MKIECVLHRQGGTHVELDGIDYHFEPLADGAHVCDVTHQDHMDRFLAVPESFKLYHGKNKPEGKPAESKAPALANTPAPAGTQPVGPINGSELLPPEFTIGDRVVTQLEAAQAAFAASGLSSDEWNELGEDDRAAKIEIALDEMADAAEGDNGDTAETEPEVAKPAAKKTAPKKTSKK